MTAKVKTKPSGGLAVANSRRSAVADSLDLYPTPPWATRAFLSLMRSDGLIKPNMVAWEPATGLGHMTEVAREFFAHVHASDVYDYGCNNHVGSFVGAGADIAHWPQPAYGRSPDWILTNPPFNNALEFALRGLNETGFGVALLVRSNWAEGGERYRTLFSQHPPQLIAQYAGRVPMHKDRWDPDGATMTSYCWMVWHSVRQAKRTEFVWLPETAEATHTQPNDRQKFASRRPPWAPVEAGTLL